MNIPITKISLSESDAQSVLETLRSGWLVQGKKVQEFEEKWCKFTGAKHSIAVTSCTTALYLSLVALGFTKNDEAIVPAFTWIATANVVEHLGGNVVFCDIDLNTFNIDVSQIESKITSKTKVIIPVHLFGLSADIMPLMKIADKYNLIVIEDAACGFGSKYNGQHVGTFGQTGCFSFHPRKAITTGEGGMITTNDDKLAEKLRQLRDHGACLSDLQRHLGPKPYLLSDHIYAGYNFRMTDIQGALGSSQMNRVEEIIQERQRIARFYNDLLIDLNYLRLPYTPPNCEHSYQSYSCLFLPDEISVSKVQEINQKRNKWMERLFQTGVSTRPATHAVHMLSYYKNKYNLRPENFPNAWIANDCSVTLPLYNGMTQDEILYVVKSAKEVSKI